MAHATIPAPFLNLKMPWTRIKHGVPEMLLYRKLGAPSISLDQRDQVMERLNQMELLEQYINKWFIGEDGSYVGAFHNFETEADFGNILETHLRKLVQKKLKSEDWAKDKPCCSWPKMLYGFVASITIFEAFWCAIFISAKPLSLRISNSLAGPAWAPRASPISCDFEAGNHAFVEKE